MKKKNLSFLTLFMLTATLVGGCSCSKQSNENYNNYVFEINGKKYSADELMKELLSTGAGKNEAFAKVLRLVVENSMETTPNIQAAADLAAESLEEDAKAQANSTGVSKDEARNKLLEEKGYTSIEEMKAQIIYEEKLERITDSYWEDNKANYFNQYIEARLPYLVRHILVKIDDTNASKIANNVAISQTDGKKLFDVIKDLEKEGDFDTVARFESEDTGSNMTGGAYYMDNTYGVNGFVDEFVYGTYAFDTYTTKSKEGDTVRYTYGVNQAKLDKLAGLSDTDAFKNYYKDGFNFVDMSIVNAMGDIYNQTTLSSKDYFTINVVDEEGKDASNLNSTENYYARSILFNKAFNKPGVSVIGYNTKKEATDAGAKHVVEYKVGNTTKYILADENDNAIFFVAARGSSNQIWVHFLTINVSALNDLEDARKFFSMNPSSEDNYISYVELMAKDDSSQEMNTYINEIESYVKSFATQGNGSTVGEESLLNYDMVRHYMSEKKINYLNEELKKAINSYIDNKKSYLKLKLENSMADDWKTHTDKLALSQNSEIIRNIKPFECGVYVKDGVELRDNPYTALTTSDHLCRYVYGKGYQVQLSFYYETTSSSSSANESFTKITKNENNRAYFSEDVYSKIQYQTIGAEGSDNIVLPTPTVKDGYIFRGWYTDKDFDNPVTSIDLSESRMTNNIIFFAKVDLIEATSINYTYQYEDGTEVDDDVVINNTNVQSKKYEEAGNNTITLDRNLVTSDYVEFVKFKVNGQDVTSFDLTSEDINGSREVVVVVKPLATKVEFKYVTVAENDDGYELAQDAADTNPYAEDTYTYNYSQSANNTIDIDKTLITWETLDLEVASIKIARDGVTFKDAEETATLTLTEADMNKNKTITIYVITQAKTTGGQG